MDTAPKPARRRRRLMVTLLAAAVAAVLVGAGLYAGRIYGRNDRIDSPDDLGIRLGKVEISDIQVTVHEAGTIAPIVKVDVKSPLSGRVVDLLAREGGRVAKGQILARVEPDVNQAQTLSQIRSELNRAEIRLRRAEKDLEASEELHERKYLADHDLRETREKYETALEDVEAARTRMRIAKESGIPLDGAISTTQRVNIVAPMDGVVLQGNVEIGQMVTSGVSSINEGTVLYTVADLRSMLVRATINEVDIGNVRPGMPVVITVDAFPYRRFDGTIAHISPAARQMSREQPTKVFDVEISLEGPSPDFRAGMTANIEIRGEAAKGALALPVESVFTKGGREVVYLVKASFDRPEDGAGPIPRTRSERYDLSGCWQRFFEERPVRIGLVGLEKAQVLEGIAAGDTLALEDPTRPPPDERY
jgi:HlyD family secretion protein